ncbi:hypothetical protein GCM10020229_49300 [Kitasatospora albolonga]|uniref:hypothetical protein n=1 Tax=Kitasatospora albolonga TaxID=68173 RepID=UPI0031ECACFC
MSKPYPVVHQQPLAEPPKRGPFGLASRRRTSDELPSVAAHEVLVFRVDGRYVLDTGRRRLDDPQLVNANHVSVVDLRRNVLVTVRMSIPSAEAAEFKVDVTFSCTVTDAAVVVQEGQDDAERVLLAYLRRHKRFFELGLDHRLADITRLRRDVNAQVMAYTAVSPPRISGMAVAYASIEMPDPDELVGFQRQRRDQDRSNVLASEKLTQNHRLDFARQQQDQLMLNHRRDFERGNEVVDQDHEQMLARERREFERREAELAARTFGDDPDAAVYWGQATGELTVTDVRDQLLAREERRQEAERERRAIERADRLQRQDRHWELQRERIEVKRQRQAELQDRSRADRKEQAALERALAAEQQANERADRAWERNATLEVVRDLIKRGHGDQTFVDFERMLTKLGAGTPALDGPEAAELETGGRGRGTKYDAVGEDDDDD